MKRERKVTILLPSKFLDKAMKASGCGITLALRRGLELVASQCTYQKLLKLKGKYKKAGFDLESSRKDRDRFS